MDLDGVSAGSRAQRKRFLSKLENLPRLCSPTICGTLSQPIMRTKESFEWSLEQKAMLSPANITVDTDPGDWHQEMDQTWRQHESEMFFSQKTIAPSPLVDPRPVHIEEEEDEDVVSETHYDMDDDDKNHAADEDDDDDFGNRNFQDNYDDEATHSEMEEDDGVNNKDGDDKDDDVDKNYFDQDDVDDNDDFNNENLLFSPQPFRSSQSQQKMDIFSPGTFVRVMEDENTLQSTPKTTTGSQRSRTRTRTDLMDI